MGECVTDASIIKYLQDRDKMFKKDETLLERVKQRGAEMMKKGSSSTGGRQEKVRRTSRLRKV